MVNVRNVFLFTLVLCTAAGFAVSLYACIEYFTPSVWMERDWLRGIGFFTEYRSTGSELTTGRNTFGNFYYFFLRLLSFFGEHIRVPQAAQLVFYAAAAAILYFSGRRFGGGLCGLFMVTLFTCSRIQTDNMHAFWNPGFTPLFGALIFYCFLNTLSRKSFAYAAAAFFFTALAAQIHMSFLYFLAPFTLILAHRRILSPAGALGCAAAFFAPYAPYIIDEISNGFSNSFAVTALLDEFTASGASAWGFSHKIFLFASYALLNTSTPLDFFESVNTPFKLAAAAVISAAGLVPFFYAASVQIKTRFFSDTDGAAGGGTDSKDLVSASFFVVFCGVVLVNLNPAISHQERYYLFLTPFAYFIAASGFCGLLALVEKQQQAVRSGSALLMLVCLLSAVYWNTGRWIENKFPTGKITYRQSVDVISAAAGRLGVSPGQFRERTAELYPKSKDGKTEWRFSFGFVPSTVFDAFSPEDSSAFGAPQDRGPCLAVFRSDLHANGGDIDTKAVFARVMSASFKPELLDVHRVKNIHTAAYTLPHGNCMVTMTNRYRLLPGEKTARHLASAIDADSGYAVETAETGRRIAFKLKYEEPVVFMVETDAAAAGGAGKLFAEKLRGRDGITEYNFESVIFELRRGETVYGSVSVFPEAVGPGGLPAGFPWMFQFPEVPPGEYNLDLKVGRAVSRFKTHEPVRAAGPVVQFR